MAKYDNCPSGASSNFKEGYEDGYAESMRNYGNSVDTPGDYPDRLREGFIAGRRQARRDHDGGDQSIFGWGCALACCVIMIPPLFFGWSMETCVVSAIILFVLSCVLYTIKLKRTSEMDGATGCGCIIASILVILAFFNSWPVSTFFLIGVVISVVAMIIDAFSKSDKVARKPLTKRVSRPTIKVRDRRCGGIKGEPADEALFKAAEAGDAKAQNKLGMCYAFGDGVAKDRKESVKWLRRAAEQGNANAQFNLGCCYIGGLGVKRNQEEAIRWMRKASIQGHAKAKEAFNFLIDQWVRERKSQIKLRM